MRARLPRGAVVLALLAACSSPKKSTAVRGGGDGGDPAGGGDAAIVAAQPTPPGAAAPYVVAPLDTAGSLRESGSIRVRVQWKNAPAALRRPAGRTACGTEAEPPLSVHTLHGVQYAVVMLAGIEQGVAPRPAPAVVLEVDGCRVVPPTAVAARNDLVLEVVSRDERPHTVEVIGTHEGGGGEGAGTTRPLAAFALPVIGSRLAVDPRGAGVYRVALADADAPPAWVVIADNPYAAITDDVGAAGFDEVPPGRYRLVTWHRPLGPDLPPLRHEVAVTVRAGESTALVVDLNASATAESAGNAAGEEPAGSDAGSAPVPSPAVGP